jgi:hypothetical protein
VGLENVYTNAVELSVASAFTGVDWWRGPPNNRVQVVADILDFHPRFHLNNGAGKFEWTYGCYSTSIGRL